jgi:protein-S-isoprenylcysteine O-methyltransferase Ste14
MSSMTAENPSGAYAWFRGFVQGKTRIALAWIFAIVLGLSARQFPTWPGIILCFFGATIRFWASGYLRKDSRPAVGGPYAWLRNPLYFGTYLMAVGTAWAIEAWIFMAVVTVLFAVIYHYIILDEETKLKRIFGEPYLHYSALVPRFFPRPWPASRARLLAEVNPETTHHRFDWGLGMKNKAYEAYASFAGLIGFVAAAAWAWQRLGR